MVSVSRSPKTYPGLQSWVDWENGAPASTGSTASEDQGAATNGYINSIATGLFANLGAQLCRVTQNTTYCDYAYNSAQWLDRFTVNSDGLVIDGLTGPTCTLSDPGSLYNCEVVCDRKKNGSI